MNNDNNFEPFLMFSKCGILHDVFIHVGHQRANVRM